MPAQQNSRNHWQPSAVRHVKIGMSQSLRKPIRTMRRLIATSIFSLGLCAGVHAQQAGHHGHDAHAAHDGHAGNPAAHGQPHPNAYRAFTNRPIKALSPEQTDDLKAGRGMSLALAAELNGYPGPLHTLELADALELTPDQRNATEELYRDMQEQAQALGVRVIEAEERLDSLFREGEARSDTLAQATAVAAKAWGRLRDAHLQAHVQMLDILSPEQVQKYRQLRGYR